MSLAGKRTQIGDALSTVAGVTGYPYRPRAPRPGDGWPLLGSLNHGPGQVFEVTWRVLVMLPQDERAASDWVDTNYEALVDGLLPVGFVDRAEPVSITTGAGEQYALQITMRGE